MDPWDVINPGTQRVCPVCGEEQFSPGLAAGGEARRERPKCHLPPRRFRGTGPCEAIVDGCGQSKGVWFDEGELQALARALG